MVWMRHQLLNNLLHYPTNVTGKSQAIIEDGRLPKFILIGVMKCGTGAMSHFMNFHPSVSELGFQSYKIHHTGGIKR